jgi:hypothetical protein
MPLDVYGRAAFLPKETDVGEIICAINSAPFQMLTFDQSTSGDFEE